MNGERVVRMAHRLYEMRKTVKFIDGDKYPASIQLHKDAIERCMKATGKDALSAMIELAKEISDKFGERAAYDVLRLGAAAVEMIEPEAGAGPKEG